MCSSTVSRRPAALAVALSATLATIGVGMAPSAAATAVGHGRATGKITDASDGLPLAGVCVVVVDPSDNQTVGQSPATGRSGVWALGSIPAATAYTAYAFDCAGGDHVGTWYGGTPFQSDAETFAVSAGTTTRAIHVTLPRGGAASGQVTDASTGAPLANIDVIAFRTDQFAAAAYGTCTDSNGDYLIRGLPTSGVKIEFEPGVCAPSSYGTLWYADASGYDSATVVGVSVARTTAGIDQALTDSSD